MAALRSITFEEAFIGLNLENVSLRIEQKEAISNILVLNKDTPANPIVPHRPLLLPDQDFIVRKLTNEKKFL